MLGQASTGTQEPKQGANQGPFTPPSITLPKGGGAVRGIGEKFAANPVTGTGSFTVPIPVSPSRAGFSPQLSLTYDTGSGNGPFGFGWSLGLPAITRKTDQGLPRYIDVEESDVYLLSGAEDLVPILRPDGKPLCDPDTFPGFTVCRYRPRIEGAFARIERWQNQVTREIHWRSITRDNVTTLYGQTEESRIVDPADTSRVFSWLICESFDSKGNAIHYAYSREDGQAARYLKRIFYGNRTSRLTQPDLTDPRWMFEVVLDYDEGHYQPLDLDANLPEAAQHHFVEVAVKTAHAPAPRPDPFSTHRPGFDLRITRRCRRVLMFHHFAELGADPYLVRSTEFDYADLDYSQPVPIETELAHPGSTRFASFILSVTQVGYVRDAGRPVAVRDGVRFVPYLQKNLPPLEFEYSHAAIQEDIRPLDSASLANLPSGLSGAGAQWVDLDGEGISGILTEQSGAWFYKPNLGGGSLGPLKIVAKKPAPGELSGGQQLLDLAGDGQLDLAAFSGPTAGFFERTPDGGWEPFQTFRRLPNIRWDEPNLRFVDLDGDGHADILITEQDAFTWHPSLAEEGFGPAQRALQALDEEDGPRLVFADGLQSISLADMDGDGLSDLVRIRSGEVCYWPNLGYGRFGKKVSLENAPWFDVPDQFEQQRIRLADIDGSGTTDILYLGRDGIRLYFNQSGNRLSDPHVLTQFPRVDQLSSVMVVDLLGNGTACLVWSSPLPSDARGPLRFIDLMGGQKPHLLTRMANNLGAETRVQYASSTRFYLEDKANGEPWITRIPFPVHVVERVEVLDRISGNRFVTSYSYHHGFFDGVEREFRGFGRVDQLDTEELAALSPGQQLPQNAPPGTNLEASSHVPPILTRTWYHTGGYFGREHISDTFAGLLDADDHGEYYREPGLEDAQARERLLEDTHLPDGLTVEEEREACRALKGSMLRQEIYALDGTGDADYPFGHPYTVTEQNFTIHPLQARGRNRHAVFLTHPRESISFHYERNPADPRVSHSLTLEVDGFGNVCKSTTIGYGRRLPDPNLAPRDQARQTARLVTYTENDFTNPVDEDHDYLTPLVCEARTYELTGYPPGGPGGRFRAEDFVQPGPGGLVLRFDEEIPFESAPTTGKQRRLIQRVRTLYRSSDLSGPLAAGTLSALALPFETYRLAFTPGLLAQVYQRRNGGLPPESLLPDPGTVLPVDAAANAASDRGGYVDLDGDGLWWIPSGQMFFSPNPTHTAPAELAFAREHFFLPHRYRDPFHLPAQATETILRYDAYNLLVEETLDALGNRVTVGERDPNPTAPLIRQGQDYRVLQPALLMEANRNLTEVAFDALGMLAGTAVMGKPEDNPRLGDLLAGLDPDLTGAVIAEHLQDPLSNPQGLLQHASTRMVYDLFAYHRTRGQDQPQPAVVYTLARETHDADPGGAQTKIQHNFTYSDGFGREIQKKVQAEAGPVPQRDPQTGRVMVVDGVPLMTPGDINPRWVGSGWTVFNNKGKPVRQYEPYFSDTHRFEFDIRIGFSPILFYDPLDRVVATLFPNHSWEKAVFDAWHQDTWDANDTLLVTDPRDDPHVGDFFKRLPQADFLPTWHTLRKDGALGPHEQAAAQKAAVHAGTFSTAHFDSLGRSFLTVARNRFKYSDTPGGDPPAEENYTARLVLDIEGNQREIRDAADRLAMRYEYDIAGNRIHQSSMEAGERWTLNDATGKPVRTWDSRGHQRRTEYDRLRRPVRSFIRGTDPAQSDPRTLNQELLFEKTEFGEGQPGDIANNLRTRAFRQFDSAGIVTNEAYDFKGNLASSTRSLVAAYKELVDWNTPPTAVETFTSATTYDAHNRPVTITTPHKTNQPASTIRPSYNAASLLEALEVNLRGSAQPTPFILNVSYNAKGQRAQIEFGSGAGPNRQGVLTTYTYDPFTFRLVRQLSQRDAASFPGDCPDPPPPGCPGCQVQDLRSTYDAAGNITRQSDESQPTIYFKNRCVDSSAEYTYDAVYRLIEAAGREHLGQNGGGSPLPPSPSSYNDRPRMGQAHPQDGRAMGRYLEQYAYDGDGNLTRMAHHGSDPAHPGWTRAYSYTEDSPLEPGLNHSNRLTATTIGADTERYSTAGDGYDLHGNMLRLPQLEALAWDFKDQLQMTRRQAVNAQDDEGQLHQGERTYYVYDTPGQRVRKVTELSSGQVKEERIYLGGFEIYRRAGGTPLERETLHVMDDQQRVALVETRTLGNDGTPQRLIRYQLGNQVGSSTLELDDQAQIISFEEYYPYGSTSFQSVRSQTETPKRYRYTGRERDEESGLSYHGARYYLPWLGRWSTADPGGLIDGTNLYRYARDNPIRLNDPHGLDPPQEGDSELVTQRDLTFRPLSSLHLGLNINAQRPTLAFAGTIQFAETVHVTTFDINRRAPSVIKSGAYLHSGYLSFNPQNYSLNLGADISLDRHFSGLGSLPSDYKLSASISPVFKESGGGIDLLRFSGNIRESLYGLDFSGNVRLSRPFQNPGTYAKAVGDLISNLNSSQAFLDKLSSHATRTFGLELNFKARLNLLNFIPSTWIWGRLGDTSEVTAVGLVAAPAGSLFSVTAPLLGAYTSRTNGDRNLELLGGGLVVPSIEAITKGKGIGESFPTYGFARGSLSFSNVNLGFGPGTLKLSAEGAISVNDLLNPPSQQLDFNQVLDITQGKPVDQSAAFRFNLGVSFNY